MDDSPGGGGLPPAALVGVVETALAEALRLAAEAERWEIVTQLGKELAARRRGRGQYKGRRQRATGRTRWRSAK